MRQWLDGTNVRKPGNRKNYRRKDKMGPRWAENNRTIKW